MIKVNHSSPKNKSFMLVLGFDKVKSSIFLDN